MTPITLVQVARFAWRATLGLFAGTILTAALIASAVALWGASVAKSDALFWTSYATFMAGMLLVAYLTRGRE